VSIIIRRYIDHVRFPAHMAVSFIMFFSYSFSSILYHCMYGYMFCMLLFNFVQAFLMYYCYICSALGILFDCVLCTVCV
jgi:hypothetical protein